MVLIEGYFDESCTDAGNVVQCIAGYLLESSVAEEMTKEWLKLLGDYELPYFHMVECTGGSKKFKKYRHDKELRIEIATQFIELIKQYRPWGLSFLFNPLAFGGFTDLSKDRDTYSLYADSVQLITENACGIAQGLGSGVKLALTFESGHDNRNLAESVLRELVKKPENANLVTRFSFERKEASPLLQAADILAWQSTAYVKGWRKGRALRKDFASLLEIPHYIAHLHTAMTSIGGWGVVMTVYYGRPCEKPAWDSILSKIYGKDGTLVASFPLWNNPLKDGPRTIRSHNVDDL